MYRIIDLFAGAGGLSLGFEKTGKFEVVAFVENNENAAKTYLQNNPDVKHYKDILTLDFNDVNNEVGKIDVVIGGPPCQGFSNANRQRRKIINGSNELVKRYVKAISILKPNMFVMENVKTIASDKHFFCLTAQDNNYIKNELGLDTKIQKVVLYDRSDFSNELYINIRDNNFTKWSQILESELYLLKNILKKKNIINNIVSKNNNIKILNTIIQKLIVNNSYEPKWIKNINRKTINVIKDILINKKISNDDIRSLELFCEIQRLFIGINELKSYNAIYDLYADNGSISVLLHTYVVINFVKKSFEYLGYDTCGDVLNAADFGVPQNRERYIMIGVKKDFIGDCNLEVPEKIINDKSDYISVKDAIEDLIDYKPSIESMDDIIYKEKNKNVNAFLKKIIYEDNDMYIYNHVCTDSRKKAQERFKQIKQGDNFHSLPNELKDTYANPERTQNTIYKRLIYNKPSDTVVNVRKSMWIHPKLNRAISAREAARLQSFPDSYRFVGTKDSVYQQIGNAVPPVLGRAIAEKVLDILEPEIKHDDLRKIYKSLKDNLSNKK